MLTRLVVDKPVYSEFGIIWTVHESHDASSASTWVYSQWRIAEYSTSDSGQTQMTIKSNEEKQLVSSYQIKSLLINQFCAWTNSNHVWGCGKQGPKVVKERLSQGDQQSPVLPNLGDQSKGEEVPPVLHYFSPAPSVNIANPLMDIWSVLSSVGSLLSVCCVAWSPEKKVDVSVSLLLASCWISTHSRLSEAREVPLLHTPYRCTQKCHQNHHFWEASKAGPE